MAVAAAYVTTELLKAFAQSPESLNSDEAWELLAKSASRAFDRAAEVEDGFFAAASASATDKTIRTSGEYVLKLPPFVPGSLETITAETGYTFPDAEDYRIEDAETGRQFLIVQNENRLVHWDSFDYPFKAEYYGNFESLPALGWTTESFDLTVRAKWGWEETPADVQQAVIEYALVHWRQGTDPATALMSDTTGTDKTTPFFRETARRYREIYSQRALFA